ncbi:hypothetical protein J6590_012968 [Homalodisca vitripennis]|nr:hypothetical protein J6590_012968 [Homalodisca vitripennis]
MSESTPAHCGGDKGSRPRARAGQRLLILQSHTQHNAINISAYGVTQAGPGRWLVTATAPAHTVSTWRSMNERECVDQVTLFLRV